MENSLTIIGSNGFIGSSLTIYFEAIGVEVFKVNRKTSTGQIIEAFRKSSWIINAAGVNRSEEKSDFKKGNVDLVSNLLEWHKKSASAAGIIHLSTIHTGRHDLYGESKLAAENILNRFDLNEFPIHILCLPNVFGKWAKPLYNSFVATLTWNISRNLPYYIDNRDKKIELLYIDDLITGIETIINSPDIKIKGKKLDTFFETHECSLGELEETILNFKKLGNLEIPQFKNEFQKKLYATYTANLPIELLCEEYAVNRDERGSFAELLKLNGSGQVSYLNCKPNQIRGNHFHNTKVEKFFHLSGEGKIVMKDLKENSTIEFLMNSDSNKVILAPPGSLHTIVNTGKKDFCLLIWASEAFNKQKPDTFYTKDTNL